MQTNPRNKQNCAANVREAEPGGETRAAPDQMRRPWPESGAGEARSEWQQTIGRSPLAARPRPRPPSPEAAMVKEDPGNAAITAKTT